MHAANPRRRGGTGLVVVLGLVTVAGIALAGPVQWGMPEWALTRQDVAPPPRPAVTAEEVAPQPEVEPEIPEPSDLQLPLTMIVVIVVILLLALAAYLLWRRLSGRRRTLDRVARVEVSDDLALPADPDVAPAVRRGIERALDILAEDREPADAVVQAWLGLEDAASASGAARLSTETPREYAARVVGRFDADSEAVADLLSLYQDVRFGAHPADAASVDAARRSLLRLRESWHDIAGAPG